MYIIKTSWKCGEIMAVTEKQIEKIDGKRVRIKIYEFKHSIHYKILTGVVRIEYDTVCTPRSNSMIQKKHVGFYLFSPILEYDTKLKLDRPEGLQKAPYIDYSMIKCIESVEVIY